MKTVRLPNCQINLIESMRSQYISRTARTSKHQTIEFTHSSNKMKFIVAALAILAVSSPINAYKLPRVGTGVLADTLQDFMDLIPVDKIMSIVMQYLAEDKEFGMLVTFLKGPEFKALIQDAEAMPEVVDLLNYGQKNGLDVYQIVNKVNTFIGLPALTPPNTFGTMKITGGIRGFLDDVEALIPVDKIKELYHKKMATSKVFVDLMTKLRSPQTQTIANAIAANPNLKVLLEKAKNVGIDTKAVIQFLETFLGIKIPITV